MSNIERTTSKADSIGVDHKETILAVEVAEENNTTVWKLLRENVRVIIFTWFANCGAFLFGYDVLVQGAINALPMFSITFGSPFGETFILPALWQGLWQAFSAMGIMAGAASNGFLQDRFGRKIMFGVGGLISAVGTAITFVSGNPETVEQRRGVLLVGKFFIGLAMGISMSTCQTYVSEISPPKLRTILLGFYPFMITVGQMIAITVVFKEVATMTHWAFKIPFASQWAFSAYSVIAALVVPESPVYLAGKNKIDQARKALTTLGCGNIDERISIIEATIQQEQRMNTEQPSFSECFKGTNLRRTRIVALLNTLQQFMGITLVSNSTYFFIMAGMTPTFSLTLNQIGVGLSMNQTALRFIGVSLLLAACTGNLGTGSAYPIVAAEVPSTVLRAKTLGIGFFVNAFMTWAFALCVPYMFNADQGNLGGKIGFVFFGFCVIGFVLTWIEIPETKNITYAQIDYLFQTKTPAPKFKERSTTAITEEA
uniref:Major facilitator superfamily (MFS) profile domain-containing protein n=1 Tax=Fusarium oxysporum (strain Fo5176) TaxID=660025 RepID=A0A0D2XLX2_FUSOF